MKTFTVTAELTKKLGATQAIQQTIDKAFLEGGGEVRIPSGVWEVNSIRIRSRVTLHLLENAHLIASRDSESYRYVLEKDIEPIGDEDHSENLWEPWNIRKNYDFMMKPISRWNCGIIRAIDATDISIIGEKDSFIDGCDCYDALGEEKYRGPHAINMHRCTNIVLKGYTIKNSANWAHALFCCKNIKMDHVTVLAGHDGIHVTSCDNVFINDCDFQTGDDCVAGIDNVNVFVSNCKMNTACSALRFGGTNVTVQNCQFIGPANYLFRGGLSTEEKKNGAIADSKGRICNMLSAYTYYSDFSRPIRYEPGNILIENCRFHNTTRFLHYNFSGNEPWQRNRPLKNIVFRNIQANGISMPLTLYGAVDQKVSLTLENITVEFEKDATCALIHAAHYDRILMRDVSVKGLRNEALIKKWSDDGEVQMERCKFDEFYGNTEVLAEEKFVCQNI